MTERGSHPRAVSIGDAVRSLLAPGAVEVSSALTGGGTFVVDLRVDSDPLEPAALGRALQVLPRLACPSLAIGDPSSGLEVFAARFDVRVADEAALAPVLRAIEASPLASLVLVQLLRHGEDLSVHEGLIAESLAYSVLQAGPEFTAWRDDRPAPPRRAEPEGSAVLAVRSQEILHLTLNRPQVHNAFSAAMRDALAEGLTVANADPGIERVVLDGAGPSFCSGGDLDEFGSFPDPATAHAVRSTRNPARLLSDCASRVHAIVHGACVGAGAELPAFTARVTAAPDAFFQLPEVAMGLVPGAGGTVSLPRRIGRQRTAWLALTGVRIDAPTAQAWGLVDELAESRR